MTVLSASYANVVWVRLQFCITWLARICCSVVSLGCFFVLDRLKTTPRPKFSVCVLGDQQHCDEAKAAEIPHMDIEALKKLNKNKKLVKKLGTYSKLKKKEEEKSLHLTNGLINTGIHYNGGFLGESWGCCKQNALKPQHPTTSGCFFCLSDMSVKNPLWFFATCS